MFNLILGRRGCGKTQLLTERILQSPNAVVIVPEQFSFDMEQRLTAERGVFGLDGGLVTSFKRLAYRAMNEYLPADKEPLSKDARCMAVYCLMEELKKELVVLRKAQQHSGFTNLLVSAISELKRYNITPALLSGAAEQVPGELLQKKLTELAKIYTAYDAFLENAYLDGDDAITVLADLIRTTDFLDGKELFIDQFSSFTPQEYSCLEAMHEKAASITVCLCTDESEGDEFRPAAGTIWRLSRIAPCKKTLLTENHKLQGPLLHLEQNYFASLPAPFAEKTDQIRLFAARNRYSELEHVAEEIIALCRDEGYHYDDIAVLARNIESYESSLRHVFARFGMPCFYDKKSAVTDHPVILFILSALEIISRGYTYEAVFRYLKSGYAGLGRDEVDLLENYVLATGIKGAAWTDDAKWNYRTELFVRQNALSEEEKAATEQLDGLRRRVVAPLQQLSAIRKKGPAREKAEALYAFIEATGLQQILEQQMEELRAEGDLNTAATYAQVYNAFVSVLDHLVDAVGDKPVTMKMFQDILRLGLSEYEIGIIPSSADSITVGSVSRSRTLRAKAVFLIGVNDGVFPRDASPGGLLGDRDKETLRNLGLELSPDSKGVAYEEQYLVYTALTTATRRLHLSYPMADMEGSTLRPSEIISRVKTMFPKVEEESDLLQEGAVTTAGATFPRLVRAMAEHRMDGTWQQVYSWYMQQPQWQEQMQRLDAILQYRNVASPLQKEQVERLMGRVMHTSVSRLETYAACPFSYYMRHMLGAAPRKVMQVSAPDSGTFLHEVLDAFSRSLQEKSLGWRQIDDSFIEGEVERISRELLGNLNPYVLENSRRYVFLLSSLKRTAVKSVKLIQKHIATSAFEPLGYELQFRENGDFKPLTITLPAGEKVVLTGRIDRADVLQTEEGAFYRIVDYKSGAKDFRLGEIYFGLTLQLAVYLTAICEENGGRPAGILYFKLQDPLVNAAFTEEDSQIEAAVQKTLKMKGLVLSDERILQAMDADGPASALVDLKQHTATAEQFAALQKQVKSTVRKLAVQMRAGQIPISPYQSGNTTPCSWCDYSAACAFDQAVGCRARQIPKLKDDEVWEKIESET